MTEREHRDDAERSRRRAPGARRRLVERDLDMLASLSAGRYLTVQALEWLHFPGWRERYRAYLEVRATQPDLVFRPAPHVYHRLGALREAAPPLVYRLNRSAEQGRLVYQPLPDAYALSAAGAELLSDRRAIELDTLRWEDPRRRSAKNLEHSTQIGTAYAALRAALEHTGHTLAGWRDDHQLASRDPERGGQGYDRVLVAGVREALPVLPDATFTLPDGRRCFLEIDRGSTNLRSWAEKIRAYEAYRGGQALRDRYGVADFTVLVLCPGENRLRRIAEELVKITRHPPERYLFALAERVHPTTIRSGWRQVAGVTWTRRQVVDRMVEVPEALRWQTLALWKNPTQHPAEQPAE
ncbi:MAG TPA: replication-relaxation family protein [Roseiflexaceae bacterium]|nr:replication-relaxation family protein [Roseiflexaceae bacterium]